MLKGGERLKLFKNKFFMICLCVAIVLCTVSTTFSLMGYREPVREVLGVIATPFRWLATVTTDAIGGFSDYFALQGSLVDRNNELEEENDRLLEENQRAQLIEEENRRLRSYLGMKEKYPTFLFEEGMVIGAEASGYVTVLTLNRGSVHGISLNMPVITEAGVVGYVTEVGLTWSKVSTILDSTGSIGAHVASSGAKGIVKGDHALSAQGLCKMTYIDEGAEIAVGDLVLSSGVGSVYPPDLVIGTVEAVNMDEYSRATVVTVRPSVDFSKLQYMMIVTGYEEVPNTDYQKPATPTPPADDEDNSDSSGQHGGGWG